MMWSIRNRVFKSKFFQSSSIYTLSTIIEKAIPFLLLPVLTRYLSPTDYGIVAMFTVLVGLTVPFSGFKTAVSILRNFYKEEIDFPTFVTNGFFIVIGGTSIVVVIYILFADKIIKYTKIPENWLFFVVVVAVGQVLIEIILTIWQAQDKPLRYGMFKILLSLINMSVALILIVEYSLGWEGRVIGLIGAVVLFALIGVYYLWKNKFLKFAFNITYIKSSLLYSAPLIPHALSALIITMIDRLFITNMIGIGATGIYTVGYQVGMIIGILAKSFSKAWVPWLFTQLNKDSLRIKKKIIKITYGYMGLILCLALVLSLSAPWFMKLLVGKDFYGATRYISWIAFGYAFSGMYSMISRYIMYAEKTYLLTIITVLTTILNIVLNFFLIDKFGAIGAAQATTISLILMFLGTWAISIKVYKMPWLLGKKW